MKKIFPLMICCLAVACSACKKDEESTQSKLQNKSWIGTALTVNPAIPYGAGTVTDLWSVTPDCTKDDIRTYGESSVFTLDEGPTKCLSTDPQTTVGTWELFSGNDSLRVTITQLGIPHSTDYYIVELDGEKLILLYTKQENYGSGMQTYTYTVTAAVKEE